jgi:hypothetical protein
VDQLRVVSDSVQTHDELGGAIPPSLPYPQSSIIKFRVNDPSMAVEVKPLGPGTIQFIADPTAVGDSPEPADVFEENEQYIRDEKYKSWKTEGTLLLRLDPKAALDLLALPTGIKVVPTVAWYSKIRITKEFLETTLAGLKDDIIGMGGEPTIKKENQDWLKHAVSRFLKGRFDPKLRPGATQPQDDIARLRMPVVEPDPITGDVQLVITVAAAPKPYDGTQAQLDAHAPPGIGEDDPRHPANGSIPARHAYRAFSPHMVDATAGNELADSWIADWPNCITYHPIRFTRIWQPLDECSIHFPTKQVSISAAGVGSLLNIPLPCHGIVFVPEDPLAPIRNITVTVNGGMRTLLATNADPWRQPALNAPVPIDLHVIPEPHVILRRTMSDEMLNDTRRPKVRLAACTFFSLRRTVRALVDHRITGGRLNFGPAVTSVTTRKLMDDAWVGTGATSNLLARDRPLPNVAKKEEIESRSGTLLPILAAFRPDLAPAQIVDGALAPVEALPLGEVAYYLWQSRLDIIKSDDWKRNFPDEDIGCGAPGAMHALGLVTYVALPSRGDGDTDDAAYKHRLAHALRDDLQAGALIQFWRLVTDFENMRDRANTATATTGQGHSPIFESYQDVGGRRRALNIIDQDPPSIGLFTDPDGTEVDPNTAGDLRITWESGDPEDIWVAANWNE